MPAFETTGFTFESEAAPGPGIICKICSSDARFFIKRAEFAFSDVKGSGETTDGRNIYSIERWTVKAIFNFSDSYAEIERSLIETNACDPYEPSLAYERPSEIRIRQARLRYIRRGIHAISWRTTREAKLYRNSGFMAVMLRDCSRLIPNSVWRATFQ